MGVLFMKKNSKKLLVVILIGSLYNTGSSAASGAIAEVASSLASRAMNAVFAVGGAIIGGIGATTGMLANSKVKGCAATPAPVAANPAPVVANPAPVFANPAPVVAEKIAVQISPENLNSFATIDSLLAQQKTAAELKKIYDAYGPALHKIATSGQAASKEAIERLEKLGDISLSAGPIKKSFDKVTDFAMNNLHLSKADTFIKNNPKLSKALAIYTLAGYAYIHIVKRYTAAQLPVRQNVNNNGGGLGIAASAVRPMDRENENPFWDTVFFPHVLWAKAWSLTGNDKACFIL